MISNQAYKVFLNNLGIENIIEWHFPLSQHKTFEKKTNDFLNSLASSFFDLNDKRKLYSQIINNDFSENTIFRISLLMEEEYSKAREKYPINKVLIEKLVKYLIDWILVIDDKLTDSHIKQTLKNIRTKNQSFWFFFIKELYDRGYNNESLLVISQKKELFKENYLLEDVVLKEIECIRKYDNYLYDPNLLSRLCLLSKDIKNYKYTLIILDLECALLSKDKKRFENYYYQYFKEIEDFDILETLNIFELTILANSEKTYGETKILLHKDDIELYKDYYEFKIYIMLEYMHDKNWEKVDKLRIELENEYQYDFKHIDWYKASS